MSREHLPVSDYVQLHTHSKNSFLASPRIAATSTPEQLVNAQLQKKYERPSLTDTENFFGVWRFNSVARKLGAKPLIGTEQFVEVGPGRAVPTTILPKTTEAFVELFDLYNNRVMSGRKMDRNDIETLSKNSVIITRGNIEYFADLLVSNPHVFRGIDHTHVLFLEKEKEYEERFHKSVVTNEVRMASPVELSNLKYQLAISGGGKELHKSSLLHYTLKSPLEISALYRFRNQDRGEIVQISRSKEIAQSIDASLPIAPDFRAKDVPGGVSAQQYLSERVSKALAEREYEPGLIERVEQEMNLIHSADFSDYIFLCLDVVDFAKRNDYQHLVTGSGNQSVVLELLGMTHTSARLRDFTRFISPDREDMPDIDIKFSFEHNEDAKNYLLRKYEGEAFPLSVIHHYKEEGIISENLKNQIFMSDEGVKNQVDAGHPKNVSTHASGIIFIDQLPIFLNPKGELVAQADKDDADKYIRRPKVDILSEAGLSRLEYIKKCLGVKTDSPLLPLDDPKVLDRIFKKGTIGISNLESPHMWNTIRMIRNVNPRLSFESIVDALSVARPSYQARDSFYNIYTTARSPLSNHPEFVEFLGATNMTAIKQDQLIQIARVAGLEGNDVEKVKKVASDKATVKDKSETQEMIRSGLISKGYPDIAINEVMKQIKTFRYSFLDGHASELAYESYELAYYAEYHPEVFWTSVFDNLAKHPASKSDYTLQVYINEAIRDGITFSFPHPRRLTELPRLSRKQIVVGSKMFTPNADYEAFFNALQCALKKPETAHEESIRQQLKHLGTSFSDIPVHMYDKKYYFNPEVDDQWVVAHLESTRGKGHVVLESGERINASLSRFRSAKKPTLYKDDFWYVRLSKDRYGYYGWTIVGEAPLP